MLNWTPPMYTLVSLAALAGLWVMLVKVIPSIVIESFRNNVFGIRNELFDRALSGEIAFDHPAYVMMRSLLNGHLRFAHNLSFMEIGVFYRVYGNDPAANEARERFISALASCTKEQREFMSEYMDRLGMLIVGRLVAGSWMMVLLVAPVIVAMLAQRPLLRLLRKPLDSLNSAALEEGEGCCYTAA